VGKGKIPAVKPSSKSTCLSLYCCNALELSVQYLEKFSQGICIAASSARGYAFLVLAFGIVILGEEFDGFPELFVCGIELGMRHF